MSAKLYNTSDKSALFGKFVTKFLNIFFAFSYSELFIWILAFSKVWKSFSWFVSVSSLIDWICLELNSLYILSKTNELSNFCIVSEIFFIFSLIEFIWEASSYSIFSSSPSNFFNLILKISSSIRAVDASPSSIKPLSGSKNVFSKPSIFLLISS